MMKYFSEIIDGEASPEIVSLVMRHINTCDDCEKVFRDLENIKKTVVAHNEVPLILNKDFTAGVMQKIKKIDKVKKISFLNIIKPIGAIAACVVLVCVIILNNEVFGGGLFGNKSMNNSIKMDTADNIFSADDKINPSTSNYLSDENYMYNENADITYDSGVYEYELSGTADIVIDNDIELFSGGDDNSNSGKITETNDDLFNVEIKPAIPPSSFNETSAEMAETTNDTNESDNINNSDENQTAQSSSLTLPEETNPEISYIYTPEQQEIIDSIEFEITYINMFDLVVPNEYKNLDYAYCAYLKMSNFKNDNYSELNYLGEYDKLRIYTTEINYESLKDMIEQRTTVIATFHKEIYYTTIIYNQNPQADFGLVVLVDK